MSGYHALFEAQHKLARQRAQRNARTLKCPQCSQRFGNPGALASHVKFSHPNKPAQKSKIDFSRAEPPKASPQVPSKKRMREEKDHKSEEPSEETSSGSEADDKPAKKRKTRARFKNYKKLALAREFKKLRTESPLDYQEQWLELHPSVLLNTVQRWVTSKTYAQLEADGLHDNPRVRNSFVSSARLEFLNQGQFPKHEEILYEKFCERREKMLVVPRIWFRTRMKKILKQTPPPDDDSWKKFTASPGWCYNFFKRFHVSKRRRSNQKSKSPQQRMEQVQKFHRTAKRFRQPPPEKDPKYGRFAPQLTFHVDQVPWEPARRIFEETYEKKGTRRVQVKGPKVDLSKRQATLQLTFAAGAPQSVRAGICFRAQPKKVKVLPDGTWKVDPTKPEASSLLAELKKMPKDIDVFYQPKAWFDTETCIAYGRSFRKQTPGAEKLLGCDNLAGQVAPRFKKYMKSQANTLLLFTPDDCTDLCAVTDAGTQSSTC